MEQNPKNRLFTVADRQKGYFTSKQAESCGFYRSHFHRFLKSGEWVKEMRGIYRLTQYPIQARSELALWALWSRNKQGLVQGVWSHETALDIHELTEIVPINMHMTVPTRFRRSQGLPNVLYLHYGVLLDEDIEVRQGYHVTTPLRSLIEVASNEMISTDQLAFGVGQALERGLITKEEITENGAKILLRYI